MGVTDRVGRFLGPRWVLRLAWAALVMQMVLVVTGALVRVTGSGLGCPSWPQCTSDSLASTAELGLHGVLEFGNRLLAVVMEAIGVLLVLVVRAHARQWTRLALVQALVVPIQAVIGGLLVLSDLNPYVLIAHFLASFPLIFAAAALLRRALGEGPAAPSLLRPLGSLLVASTAAVLVMGTLVTGTGPHAGDPDVERLPFDPVSVTRLHTDAVYVLVGLVLAVLAVTWSSPWRRWTVALAGLVLAQGALGYWQYFHNVAAASVATHVGLATVVFSVATWLQVSSRQSVDVIDRNASTSPGGTAEVSSSTRR